VESGGIWHIPAESADFHHTFPVDSGGLVRWIPEDHKIPLDKSDGFRWTSPTDSAGLLQQIPLDLSDGFRWTSPTDSTGLSPRA
jgi:hypothetical protein